MRNVARAWVSGGRRGRLSKRPMRDRRQLHQKSNRSEKCTSEKFPIESAARNHRVECEGVCIGEAISLHRSLHARAHKGTAMFHRLQGFLPILARFATISAPYGLASMEPKHSIFMVPPEK
jgi:hypothetical protein